MIGYILAGAGLGFIYWLARAEYKRNIGKKNAIK